jgi:hypothetical protein
MNVAVLQDCSLKKPGEAFDLKPETAVRETQNGELRCWGRSLVYGLMFTLTCHISGRRVRSSGQVLTVAGGMREILYN